MTDIFMKEDVGKLLKNKHVVFMGDSNIRALYKDVLCLSQKSQLITNYNLKNKMENSVYGDKLVFHGRKYNGRDYREEREMCVKGFKFSYFFLTRVYDKYVEAVIKRITSSPNKPNVVIVNSCVWDVTRWGPQGIENYKNNLIKLMQQFQKYLPEDCLVIWSTAPPISSDMNGGFIVKELQFLKYSVRFHVLESNHYARKVVVQHGYDVLDFHYHLRMQLYRREKDGIHWSPEAVRYLLNLLLTHISLAWGKPLPHRYDSVVIKRTLEVEDKNDSEAAEQSEQKLTLQSVVAVVNNAGKANVKNKELVADEEQQPAVKKMKHVKITPPSPSTPRRPTSNKFEKENSSAVSRKRKGGRIQGSCGAFMKKCQDEQRHKKKGRHQSHYANNFNRHVSIPPFNEPPIVTLHPSLSSHSPYPLRSMENLAQHTRVPSSPGVSMSPSFRSPYFPNTNQNPNFLSCYSPSQLPYSPSQPTCSPSQLPYSPSQLPYSPSQPTCSPSQLPYSPSQPTCSPWLRPPYSPLQPLEFNVNSPFFRPQFYRTRPNNFSKQREFYRSDAIPFSPSYFSFE